MRAAVIVALWVAVSIPTALVVAAVIRATRGTELSEEVEFYLKGLRVRHGAGLQRRVRILTVSAIGIVVAGALVSGFGGMPSRVYAVADQTRELFGAGPGPHPPPFVRVDQPADPGPSDEAAPAGRGGRRGDAPIELAGPDESPPVSRAPDLSFTQDGDGDADPEAPVGGSKAERPTPSGLEVHRDDDDHVRPDDEPPAPAEDEADRDREHDRDRDRRRQHDRADEPTPTTTAPPPPPVQEEPTPSTTAPPTADEPPAGGVEPPPADDDGDGVENGADRDLDGDGVENADDADVDGDEQANTEDTDIDGDGVANADDPTPYGHVPEDDGRDDNDPPPDGDQQG
jgi:hypothetical protein